MTGVSWSEKKEYSDDLNVLDDRLANVGWFGLGGMEREGHVSWYGEKKTDGESFVRWRGNVAIVDGIAVNFFKKGDDCVND